jgi:hypothetical protein
MAGPLASPTHGRNGSAYSVRLEAGAVRLARVLVDGKRRGLRVEHRWRMGDLSGNSRRVGITVNAGQRRGGGKEGGGPVAFVDG